METSDQGRCVRRGYVHVYTGNGKGKTTAALGLVLRAAGAGLRVFVAQFAKGSCSSELHALARLADRVTIRQFGLPRFIAGAPTRQDSALAAAGLGEVHAAVHGGEYDVVVLDEANIGTAMGLIDVDWLLDLIEARPEHLELVLTGRGADPRIVARADLVTDMCEVKHYFRQGIPARIGIEM